MTSESKTDSADRLVFAEEDATSRLTQTLKSEPPWKVLIVDDEADVHEITRITLRAYVFENRGLELLSAYSETDVRQALEEHPDIALILLDVVMEADDTGLRLVEHIRKELKNTSVRIVLRTGQPGKAPEQEVIVRYDINDYRTKPEFTAQKLFTTVTACLRAYGNLKAIEKNNEGLEAVIRSSTRVFKNQSLSEFADTVLLELFEILHIDRLSRIDSAYFIAMPNSRLLLMAGTGRYRDQNGSLLEEKASPLLLHQYKKLEHTGGELFSDGAYVGVFRTREGFTSLLFLDGCDRLTHVEKRLIRIYANNIAIGFDNISLSREIINTQKEVILTLGEIVETRSQETANHVVRVAEICYLLARKSKMNEQDCDLLRLASPMHDVGKIGIPEAILNKPGQLTGREFEIIKKHAGIGHAILSKSNRPIMKAAAIIALQHHERWDGSGYPQGLSGGKIHVFGRIAAIADVFDALSHKRCYKPAWEIPQITALFKEESGRHFDSQLSGILLNHMNEFEAIKKRFPE